MSIINELIKKADSNGGYAYATCEEFDSILHTIEIGTLEGSYYAFKEEKKPRRIEVWLHFNRPITAEECPEFKCILDNNDIAEDNIKCGDLYNYHLSYFSVAWLNDIFPTLLNTKMPETEWGCDLLELSKMDFY